MAKHPALNDATRTARVISATRESRASREENQAYFDQTIIPVLEGIYADLASKGQTPYRHSLASMMSWISDQTYMGGRFQRADPNPYFQNPLIDAYKNGGKRGLTSAFLPLLHLLNQRHNAIMDRASPEDLEALAKAGKDIQKILAPEPEPLPAQAAPEAPPKRSLLERLLGIGGKSLQHSFNQEAPRVEKAPVVDKEAQIDKIVRANRDLYLGVNGMFLWQSPFVTADSFVTFAQAHESGTLKAAPLDVTSATLKKNANRYPNYLIRR